MPPKTNEDLIEEFFAKENDTAYSVDIAASGGDLNSKEYTRELLTPKLRTLLTEKDKQREEAVAEVKKAERERLFKRVNAMSWEQKNETEDAIRILKELYNFLTPPTN